MICFRADKPTLCNFFPHILKGYASCFLQKIVFFRTPTNFHILNVIHCIDIVNKQGECIEDVPLPALRRPNVHSMLPAKPVKN